MNTSEYPQIKDMSLQILVTDINRSLEFYTRKLGLKIAFSYEGFYFGITKNGYSVHLKLASPAIEERENRRKNEHLDILFSVEGIKNWYESIKSEPVVITQPLREMPYGKEFYISDPDGYIIAFLEENQ